MEGAVGESNQQEGNIHTSIESRQHVWTSVLLLMVWFHDRFLVSAFLLDTGRHRG
jgi:hypothetical protein